MQSSCTKGNSAFSSKIFKSEQKIFLFTQCVILLSWKNTKAFHGSADSIQWEPRDWVSLLSELSFCLYAMLALLASCPPQYFHLQNGMGIGFLLLPHLLRCGEGNIRISCRVLPLCKTGLKFPKGTFCAACPPPPPQREVERTRHTTICISLLGFEYHHPRQHLLLLLQNNVSRGHFLKYLLIGP